jgi:hypothetical protein
MDHDRQPGEAPRSPGQQALETWVFRRQEVSEMTRRTISISWIVGSIVMFLGFFAAMGVAIATNSGNPMNGQSAALFLSAFAIAAVGIVLQLVAWSGSLFNAHLLPNKRWFNMQLWIGIVGIVTSPFVIGGLVWWALMLAYLIGAPDGEAYRRAAPVPTQFSPTS